MRSRPQPGDDCSADVDTTRSASMLTTFGFDCSAATSDAVRSATKPFIALENEAMTPEFIDATATELAVLLANCTM